MSKACHRLSLLGASSSLSIPVLLMGSVILAGSALAQESPAPVAPCSGIMCVFSPAAAPQPAAPAPPPAATAAAEAVVPEPDAAETKTKPKPKPVHQIVIAADVTDAPRLKALAASMPKEKIKVVTGQGAEAKADFSVATAFDAPDKRVGATKARLFTEQLHIVAGGTIKTIADLEGKVVSFGAADSPSREAGRKAFETLHVAVKETPLDLDNALDGLSTGDIDAVVILAPQPVARLAKVSAPGLHLVGWPDGGALPEGATAATIDAALYPGLATPGVAIPAFGTDAVLTMSAKAARLPTTKTFLAALADRSSALSRQGFDLIKADIEDRSGRRVASAERR